VRFKGFYFVLHRFFLCTTLTFKKILSYEMPALGFYCALIVLILSGYFSGYQGHTEMGDESFREECLGKYEMRGKLCPAGIFIKTVIGPTFNKPYARPDKPSVHGQYEELLVQVLKMPVRVRQAIENTENVAVLLSLVPFCLLRWLCSSSSFIQEQQDVYKALTEKLQIKVSAITASNIQYLDIPLLIRTSYGGLLSVSRLLEVYLPLYESYRKSHVLPFHTPPAFSFPYTLMDVDVLCQICPRSPHLVPYFKDILLGKSFGQNNEAADPSNTELVDPVYSRHLEFIQTLAFFRFFIPQTEAGAASMRRLLTVVLTVEEMSRMALPARYLLLKMAPFVAQADEMPVLKLYRSLQATSHRALQKLDIYLSLCPDEAVSVLSAMTPSYREQGLAAFFTRSRFPNDDAFMKWLEENFSLLTPISMVADDLATLPALLTGMPSGWRDRLVQKLQENGRLLQQHAMNPLSRNGSTTNSDDSEKAQLLENKSIGFVIAMAIRDPVFYLMFLKETPFQATKLLSLATAMRTTDLAIRGYLDEHVPCDALPDILPTDAYAPLTEADMLRLSAHEEL
jgi:hypothetical protein